MYHSEIKKKTTTKMRMHNNYFQFIKNKNKKIFCRRCRRCRRSFNVPIRIYIYIYILYLQSRAQTKFLLTL